MKMTQYSQEQISKYLQLLMWDSTVKGDELLPLLSGEADQVKGVTRFNLYVKILNGFNWHKVRRIIPEERLNEALSDEVIKALFPRSLRETYQYVRSLL